MSVDLIIQHVNTMRRIKCTKGSFLYRETKMSNSYHHMRQFQKNFTERKIRVLNRSVRLPVRFLTLKIIARRIITNVHWFMYKENFNFVSI